MVASIPMFGMNRLYSAAMVLRGPGWLVGLALVVACGGPVERGGWGRDAPPGVLDAWVTVSHDDHEGVVPVVGVSLPYRSLVFHRQNGAYRSTLRVTVTAWRGNLQVGGGVSDIEITADSEAQRGGDRPATVMTPIHIRGGEPVRLDVVVMIPGTVRRWERRLALHSHALETAPVLITSLATSAIPDEGGRLLLPATADTLRLQVGLLRTLRGVSWPAGGVDLVSEASGASLENVRRLRRSVPSDLAPGDSLCLALAWPTQSLPFGAIDVRVLLVWDGDEGIVRLPREPALDVVNLRVPLSNDQIWFRHLEWLKGRLSAAEHDSLRRISDSQRDEAWRAIWDRQASVHGQPAGDLERKHLLRIVEADERFDGFGRGALSDRGRVFIRWGEPTRIEVHADGRSAGGVWEVWSYAAERRRFLFHDAHGIGDYRLRRDERY